MPIFSVYGSPNMRRRRSGSSGKSEPLEIQGKLNIDELLIVGHWRRSLPRFCLRGNPGKWANHACGGSSPLFGTLQGKGLRRTDATPYPCALGAFGNNLTTWLRWHWGD